MIIDKYLINKYLRIFSCNHVEKFEKKILFKLKTQFKKNLLYYKGTFLCNAHAPFFIAEARSVYQFWEARVCIAEAHGVWGFRPSCSAWSYHICVLMRTVKLWAGQYCAFPQYFSTTHRDQRHFIPTGGPLLQYFDFRQYRYTPYI